MIMFLTGFLCGSIITIIVLCLLARLIETHKLRPRGASGENSIMENGEQIVTVLRREN